MGERWAHIKAELIAGAPTCHDEAQAFQDAQAQTIATGEPRDYRDVEIDPEGILIHKPGEPLRAAEQPKPDEYPEAAQVCAQAYQVVGSLLSDLGAFGTEHGRKILDNLSEHRLVHNDVLPWPSFEQPAQGEPKYTTGHCENHKQPGGCQLHNLHCRYPECDRKPAQGEGEK